jgi:hypothetical protein
MTDQPAITLNPCPFCGADCAEVLAVEIDMYAGMCRACGAHGPVRVLGPQQLVEFVKAQAAADWNGCLPAIRTTAPQNPAGVVVALLKELGHQVDDRIAYSVINFLDSPAERPDPGHATRETTTEPPGGDSGSEPEQPPEKAPIDPAASPPGSTSRAAPMAGSLDGWPEGRKTPDPVTPQGPCAPVESGGEGPGLNVRQLELRDRLARLLGELGMSHESAIARGMKLGASSPTLYNILKGKRVSDATLDSVEAALAKIERGRKLSGASAEKPAPRKAQQRAEYDESLVEKLPNTLPPATGVNRSPPPAAPPRCARTP